MVFYWIVGSLTIFYAYGESKLLGSSAFRPGLIYLTTNHMLIMYLNHHVGFHNMPEIHEYQLGCWGALWSSTQYAPHRRPFHFWEKQYKHLGSLPGVIL